MTSVCSACGKAVSTQSCWTTMASYDAAYHLSGCWHVISRLSLFCGHRSFASKCSSVSFVAKLEKWCSWVIFFPSEKSGWPCRFSQECTFSPSYPIFPFCLSLRKTEKRDQKREGEQGTHHPSLDVSEDAN